MLEEEETWNRFRSHYNTSQGISLDMVLLLHKQQKITRLFSLKIVLLAFLHFFYSFFFASIIGIMWWHPCPPPTLTTPQMWKYPSACHPVIMIMQMIFSLFFLVHKNYSQQQEKIGSQRLYTSTLCIHRYYYYRHHQACCWYLLRYFSPVM